MKDKILSIIANILKIDTTTIDETTIIGEPNEWNSLNHIVIITTLEKEFSIKFTTDNLIELETISDIIYIVNQLVTK